MRLYNMIGYKLYKENEDGSIDMIRIVGMHKPFKITDSTKDPVEIMITRNDSNKPEKVRVDSLKDYTPLKPDAVLTFSIVNVVDENDKIHKDVIITATKYVNMELDNKILHRDTLPYAVCRQSITDVFNNLIANDTENLLVGLAVNQDTCPANFDFRIMLAANSVVYNDFINMYRSDELIDMLSMINEPKYDEVLKSLFLDYIKASNQPQMQFKNECGGWCKNLRTLLVQNNFQADINQMLGITDVDFKVADYLEEKQIPGKEETYTVARDDLRYWLSSIYKLNMSEVAILEFGHDINLGDFNETKYLLLRDSDKKLYLAVYTLDGQYFESDLEEKAKELDFTSKFKLSYMYSKYADNNK